MKKSKGRKSIRAIVSLVAAAVLVCQMNLGWAETFTKTYEAEENTTCVTAEVAINKAGFAGKGFVDYGGENSSVMWNNIEVPSAGSYTLTFRYANGADDGVARNCLLELNGVKLNQKLEFKSTGDWENWENQNVTVDLKGGKNSIKVVSVGNGPNLDSVTVTNGKAADTAPTVTTNTVTTLTMVLKLNDPKMVVNGVQKDIDQGKDTTPILDTESNRTLVPIRALVEAMGGKIAFDAGDGEGRVDISLGSNAIKIWLNNKNAQLNGKAYTLDVTPKTINDRTMLPLRFVTESLGAQVNWNDATQEITIKYINSASAAVQEETGKLSGLPGDTNIKYFGRWTDDGQRKISNWGGAYFKVDFTGTTVKLKLSGGVKLAVKIDNMDEAYYPSAAGTVDLTPTPLTAGQHSLRVASQYQSDIIRFEGLILDQGATTCEPKYSNDIIEFIGDSITSGYLLDSTGRSGLALKDYAWLAAEALNCEHTQIAWTGICLTDGVVGYSKKAETGMSVRYFKTQSNSLPGSADWDLSQYHPKVIVINLGTNDGILKVKNENYQNVYAAFLKDIRSKHPDAYILALRPFGGLEANPISNAVKARISEGDTRLAYIDTNGWLTKSDYFKDGVHPTAAGHQKVANALVETIKPYLKN